MTHNEAQVKSAIAPDINARIMHGKHDVILVVHLLCLVGTRSSTQHGPVPPAVAWYCEPLGKCSMTAAMHRVEDQLASCQTGASWGVHTSGRQFDMLSD